MDKYQIFISYRRDGGDALAGRLADRFNALGYKVFYDVESMRSGTFNTQILDAILQCDDVLLVLPPNVFDRCVNEDDWVRQELAFALKHNKNIIPIMMRGFEFPNTLPADIDNIRNMEGVTASSEYFDAVIDRIKSLLLSKLKRVEVTKFPVFEDTEFSEEVIQDVIFYHLLNNPIPDTLKDEVSKSLIKYYKLHGSEYKGVSGRSVLHTVQCTGKWYNLYDVFYYKGKKYAYGLEANIKLSNQQVGVFFSIDEDESVKPILIGSLNAIFSDVATSDLFTWYVRSRRGFGGVPDVLLPLLENQMKQFSVKDMNTYADFIGLDKHDINNISNLGTDKTIEYLRAINENMLYVRVSGIYNGIGVFLGHGNCYGNTFQGYYAGKVIRTPIRKKVILDIVPTIIENHYIALVYKKKTKKGVAYLLEGPEYYLITKKEGELDFCKISESNLEFWCGKYFERFALIYMQAKLLIVNAFLEM